MKAVWLVVFAVAVVHAIDIDLVTKPTQILSQADPSRLTVATTFSTEGGTAGALETVTLLLDGEPAVRLVRIEGETNGKNAEMTLVTASMPKPVRDWIRPFIGGKYKRRKVSIVTKTGTGPEPKKQPLYSRFDYTGVIIREIQFPALGQENGRFHIRVMYQSATETPKQQAIHMLDVPVRSEFFKFNLKGSDPKDKTGERLAKSIFGLDAFTVARSAASGKSESPAFTVAFPATTDSDPKKKDGILPLWQRWFGADKQTTRNGKLTLYYWTGSSMEAGAADARGQLKILFELELKDLSITKLDSGEGRATLSTDHLKMSDH